jgi:hypothetical protein
MQRLKVTEEPRDMERPDRVHDDLERCTPQFILRNTWRAEKYGDPDSLDFEYKSVQGRGARRLSGRRTQVSIHPR